MNLRQMCDNNANYEEDICGYDKDVSSTERTFALYEMN